MEENYLNDFTKEELEKIYEACTYWFECPDDGIMEEAKELVGKIYSMIDNHCKHEKDGKVYDGILGLSFKCIKCGNFI